MARTVYRIREWETFETANSKRYKTLPWVAVPTKQDGKGRRRLVRRENGAALFGAWNALVQVAAQLPVRGVLADETGPLDADDMEVKTDLPAALFDELFTILTDPAQKIGWLESTEWPLNDQDRTSNDQAQASNDHGCLANNNGCSTKRNETEPEQDITRHDVTEPDVTEPDPTDSASLPERARCFSGSGSDSSGSGSDGVKRLRAQLAYDEAMKPLMGRNGNGRHPRGSPQHTADTTCKAEWWDAIWPPGALAVDAIPRFEAVLKLAKTANDKNKPMAWLTKMLKQEGIIP